MTVIQDSVMSICLTNANSQCSGNANSLLQKYWL